MFEGVGLSDGGFKDGLIELVEEGNVAIIYPDLGNHPVEFDSEFEVLMVVEDGIVDVF